MKFCGCVLRRRSGRTLTGVTSSLKARQPQSTRGWWSLNFKWEQLENRYTRSRQQGHPETGVSTPKALSPSLEDALGCRVGRGWRSGGKLQALKASVGCGWEPLLASQLAGRTRARAPSRARPWLFVLCGSNFVPLYINSWGSEERASLCGTGCELKHLLEDRQQCNPFIQPCLQLLFINLA